VNYPFLLVIIGKGKSGL